MHSLLKRQVKRFFRSEEAVPPELRSFMRAVEQAYDASDEDRRMLERSLELSSGELLRANAEMRAIFENFPDLLFRLDGNGTILEVKGGDADLWPDRDNLVNCRVQDIPVASVAQAFGDAIARVGLTLERVPIEYTLTISGREGVYEARLAPAPGGQILAIIRNITERKLAERQLAAQRGFLRQVIDLAPNFIFAKDRHGRFTLVNQAVAEVYGTTVECLLGKTDADFNPNSEEVAHYRRDDLEVIETRREKRILEEKVTDATGNVRLLQTIKRAIPAEDGTDTEVLGVSTDITERKKMEAQLLQSQKMEAIGLLAGGVAHDFNNLLSVIMGHTQLAIANVATGHPMQENLKRISTASLKAAELTRKLLAFSRRQVLRVQAVDLNQVIGEFSLMLDRILGEDIEVQVEPPGRPLVVRVDAGQIEQVLLNLCTNARHAMPKGGRLVIRTKQVMPDPDLLLLHAWARAVEHVELTVADTGVGMDAGTIEHIFEPFFTTKVEGTGLGLATVYGIVCQHAGFMQVESTLGQGTTFRIYLPLDPEAKLEPAGSAIESARGGHETILLAEDESMLRELVTRSLSGMGYRVLAVENGEQALRTFDSHIAEIRLVVMDAVMPRLNGPDALLRMRIACPNLRAVIVSGYAPDSAHLTQLLDQEGVRFLSKPFQMQELAATVRTLLDYRG